MDGDVVLSVAEGGEDKKLPLDGNIASRGISVRLVSSADDLDAVKSVRSVVWLNDPQGKYREQFDQNDWSCSHVIAFVDDEPVGTLRIRWFGEFARFERMAIRSDYRNYPLFRRLIMFSLGLCRGKGYRSVIGMSRDNTVAFWRRMGGRIVGDPISYHGYVGIPMRIDLAGNPALGVEWAGHPHFEAALSRPENELVA